MRLRKRPLAMERLDRRELFAAFAVPWPEIGSLRLSFVPDGTQIGTSRSELFSMLESTIPTVDWQLQMLTAFQTWGVETNANIGLVADQGQPIGTIGFKQGDLRFGDVRFGAFPMEQDVLAVANPYDPFIANTWVGDVFLNSVSNFLRASQAPAESLLSVMLHEAGHVFGVGHSTDVDSPMYPYFQDIKTTLTAQDIAALRSLYGTRTEDRWEGERGNGSVENATTIRSVESRLGQTTSKWAADIGSLDDVDTFSLIVPSGAHSLSIELDAQGTSLLTANLSVLNEQGVTIASTTALDPRTNDLKLIVNDVREGETVFVKVRSADQSVFGIGTYELKFAPLAENSVVEPPLSLLALQGLPDFAEEEWMVTTPGYVEHTYYELAGTLTAAKPSQRFRFHAPILDDSLTNVFTIILTAETGDIDNLGLRVTDDDGNEVAMTLISSKGSKVELQVTGVRADVDYFATVYAKDLAELDLIYELEVDFAHDGRLLETLLNETLSDSQPTLLQPLNIDQSGHYHFVISTSDWSSPHDSDLVMQVLDSGNTLVASTRVVDGSSQWLDLFLNRGKYTVAFMSPGRLMGATTLVQLAVNAESSPIGPQLRDMSSTPVERLTGPPIDALILHWLPGYQATEQHRFLTTHTTTIPKVSGTAIDQGSTTPFREFSFDAERELDKRSEAEHNKPKKSERKPWSKADQKNRGTQPREARGVEQKQAMLPAWNRASFLKSDPQDPKDKKPSVAPERLRDASVGLSELQVASQRLALDLGFVDDDNAAKWKAVNQHSLKFSHPEGGPSAKEGTLPEVDWETDNAIPLPNSLAASILAIGLALVQSRRRCERKSTPTVLPQSMLGSDGPRRNREIRE